MWFVSKWIEEDEVGCVWVSFKRNVDEINGELGCG